MRRWLSRSPHGCAGAERERWRSWSRRISRSAVLWAASMIERCSRLSARCLASPDSAAWKAARRSCIEVMSASVRRSAARRASEECSSELAVHASTRSSQRSANQRSTPTTTDAGQSSATKVPPARPRRFSMRPRVDRSSRAARTVVRPTPRRGERSRSGGKRVPGRNSPTATAVISRSVTRSTSDASSVSAISSPVDFLHVKSREKVCQRTFTGSTMTPCTARSPFRSTTDSPGPA